MNMTRLVLLAGTMLLLFLPNIYVSAPGCWNEFIPELQAAGSVSLLQLQTSDQASGYSAMEALDLVKNRYASTFVKSDIGQADGNYYYRLPEAELYLVYEGMDRTGKQYLFHLYEFIIDDAHAGVGHSYTYGWYAVEIGTGLITDLTN
jgi:hypothetical protein